MASTTFLNLTIEKQEKILQAAVQEFSEKPFSDVSINKIIKNAEISRGSFYTYFADKYDLLVYLLTRFKNHIRNQLIDINKDVRGSLKKMIIELHAHVFELYQNQTNQKFLFNIIVYFQAHDDEEIKDKTNQLPFLNDCDEIYTLLDLKQFRFVKEKEIKQTIDIAFTILKNTLFITALKKLNYEKSKTLLEEYLQILQHGYMEEKNA